MNEPSCSTTFKIHMNREAKGRIRLREGEKAVLAEPRTGSGRIPRVTRLMALAIRFDRLVASGQVRDFAEMARLGHVTRARISQITNLLNLAPDIQEALLFLPPVLAGDDPITERDIRPIACEPDWAKQQSVWQDTMRGP